MNRTQFPTSTSVTAKPDCIKATRLQGRKLRPLALAMAAAISQGAVAGPDGGVVIDGSANIVHAGNVTDISQHSQNITVVWDNFDIDVNEVVNFLQPNSQSLALNRVLSADGTQINGQLNANGRVFVLDANGVLFGKNAKVNVGSLVASTLDLTHSDYDTNTFTFNGGENPAAVTNLGEITAAETGAVALLGGRVSNYGVIQAKLGNVALAAGQQVTLDFAGDGLLNVQVDEAALDALAENHGLIKADGGQVLMTAHASDALLQTVVNNTGVIEAQTLQEKDGKIMLLGGMTPETGGTVRVSGTLDASAPTEGDGGFIDTSGAIVKVGADAKINTASANGAAGTWLLDPTDLEISYDAMGADDDVSHTHTQALQNALESGNVILETADAGGGAGDITVVDPIVWASSNTLTLDADGGIAFNDYLHAPSGGLSLNAVGDISTGAEGHINVGTFTLESGNFEQITANLPTFKADDFVINGGTFTRATGGNGASSALTLVDAYGLQGLATTPSFDATLDADIDLSVISNFQRIGDDATAYTGSFDGNGHFINNLTINVDNQYETGLFGFVGAGGSVANVGLYNASVTATSSADVGILVGRNEGSVSNSFAEGSVTADDSVGGLVGWNNGNGIVQTSYSTASVSALDGTNGRAGGLVGYNGGDALTTASWASGAVSGGGEMGGLVGYNQTNATVSNSYADSDTTGLSAVIGQNDGASTDNALVSGDGGVNPSAFQQASYIQFDFSNDWFIAEDSSRPMLRAFLDGGNISNLYQLQGMAADLTGSYTLLNDIDASATASNNTADVWGGGGFAPIGVDGARFTGDFDGQGFVISQLAISRSSQDYVGLFGATGAGAGLVNVRLQGASIAGNNLAGGLVGYNDGGTITNSYIAGSVVGRNQVGALVGDNSGDISSSYATATVDGNAEVGGLVGFNDNAEITNSYATGAVNGNSDVGGLVGSNGVHGEISSSYATGNTAGSSTGGLVGSNGGSVINSYWDTFTTGQATSDGGTAVNGDWDAAPNAYNEGSYTGFDFTNEWFIAEGSSRPMLRAFLSGGGEIHNLYDLQGMAADMGASYSLMSDIDASATAVSVAAGNSGDYSDVWGGRGFAPIANNSVNFQGSVDGQNFVVNDLTINRPDQFAVGLISLLENTGQIQNVGLVNADITGGDVVGGLVGWSFAGSSISHSFVTGVINGDNRVGGIIGDSNSDISNSYSAADVTAATGSAGGLAGLYFSGTLSNSYASGNVAGGTDVGGLVGTNSANIITSFWNSANASGFGSNTGTVDAESVGLTLTEFTDPASFSAWGADIDAEGGTGTTWRIYEGNSAPLLRSFLTEIDVIAYDDYQVYDGAAYDGLHDINGTTGAGVRYGTSYAEFVSVFGENDTPYDSDDINSTDLEYAGDSQGAVDAGTYSITPSELWSNQTGYDIVVTDGVLTIDQAVVSVTVTINDASKVYGEADPTFTWGVTSGSLGAGDTLTGSLYRDPGENVGTYDIHGNITGDLASSNYIVTLNEGVFTITPRAITISIDDLSKVYGEMDPELTYSVNGSAVAGDTLAVALTRESGENVGDYAITGEVSGDAAGDNYSVTFSDGLFTITPRAVTISISDLEKIYGDDDPELTWAVTEGSLAPGETLQGSLSRAEGENVGDYAINGELSGEVASDNYAVTLNDGMLTINPRPIVISADDLVKIYGQQDPELTYSQAGTLAFDDTMTVALERAEGSDVGGYTITPTVTGDVQSDNYALSVNTGVLQITPAQLTVTAEDVETYWDLLPNEFPTLIDGLTNGDTEQDVFGDSLTVETDLTLPIPGDYTLTPIATLASNNYTVSFVDGVLTLLSSNPGTGYGDGLTSTQLPARESLGGEDRANIYEGRALLDGSLDEISLGVMNGGNRMSEQELMDIGLPMPRAVLFAINSSEIQPMYADMLQAFVKKLEHYPDLTLLIEGHTSKTGPFWLNQRLARERAMAVYNHLVELGIDPARLGTKGFDWSRPIGDNSTLEGRALNRRAEVTPDQPRNDGEQTNDQ
ncbi:MBG domain-containing protein [Gilvimarinus sp. DA14]|uniref:MBG domain-containing protein n=1 Tax=Gilvimarinus sp. DA14 TaxID=2956798 RepID=UPI0020B7EC1D|nr:MBG domain-containing protein [Gilvimarinus sp. DA14]UTF59038.1 filamentous hemagglutinin N-terminal domain-containing protein [Gilvimarinus sp. DA14]